MDGRIRDIPRILYSTAAQKIISDRSVAYNYYLFLNFAEAHNVHYNAREQDYRHNDKHGGQSRPSGGSARTAADYRNGKALRGRVVVGIGSGVHDFVSARHAERDGRAVVLGVAFAGHGAADGCVGDFLVRRIVQLFGYLNAVFVLDELHGSKRKRVADFHGSGSGSAAAQSEFGSLYVADIDGIFGVGSFRIGGSCRIFEFIRAVLNALERIGFLVVIYFFVVVGYFKFYVGNAVFGIGNDFREFNRSVGYGFLTGRVVFLPSMSALRPAPRIRARKYL